MVKKQKVLKSLLVPNYFKRQNVLTLASVLFYKKIGLTIYNECDHSG